MRRKCLADTRNVGVAFAAAGLASALAALVAGCGGPIGGGGASASAARRSLESVGELYRIYTVSNNKPPAKLADLAPLSNASPAGIAALKAGEVVVRYGATMTDTTEGGAATSSDEVLAFEKKVPEGGGDVLMLDRTVKAMTAEEFKRAKKAGKE